MSEAKTLYSRSYARALRPQNLRAAQTIFDATALGSAFAAAYLLRFDFALDERDVPRMWLQLIAVVGLQIWVLRLFKVHRFIWRYVGLTETKLILLALCVAAVPPGAIRILPLPEFLEIAKIPVSIIVLNFCLASLGVLGIRFLRREIYETKRRARTRIKTLDKKRVLLVGAGKAGVLTLAEIKGRGDIDLEVKGFVDDDRKKLGSVINGVKVLGATEQIPQLAAELAIDHAIISIAQTSRGDFQRIVEICRRAQIKVRTIPGLYELLQDKVNVSRIREIKIEDLLGRPPVQLDERSIKKFLHNKVVAITGAGGSIGSELVRQLANCNPQRLVLIERSEFALFNIEREIRQRFPHAEIVPVVGDICDRSRMFKVFQTHEPQVVFHAAAHKHVPMMEHNAAEALRNNVLGTNTIANLAGQFNVESFVLISTDKAVNPTSIMGATKRLAELVVQDLNSLYDTQFVAVRFGNVIGSNGSVIPIFQEQIRAGGPVTVTHAEMKRFFMTIPEATQLVLQAGALGRGGEIFILNMGEPVKIVDLARETIRLSGLEPDVDVQIEFTGMRPGEKLIEELEGAHEKLTATVHPKIFLGTIASHSHQRIADALATIKELIEIDNDAATRNFLCEMLPEAKLECAGSRVQSEPRKREGLQPQQLIPLQIS